MASETHMAYILTTFSQALKALSRSIGHVQAPRYAYPKSTLNSMLEIHHLIYFSLITLKIIIKLRI